MQLKMRMAYAIGLSMILSSLGACATGSHDGDFCLLYRPVYTSNFDTEETRHQTDLNNALWLVRCPQPKGG